MLIPDIGARVICDPRVLHLGRYLRLGLGNKGRCKSFVTMMGRSRLAGMVVVGFLPDADLDRGSWVKFGWYFGGWRGKNGTGLCSSGTTNPRLLSKSTVNLVVDGSSSTSNHCMICIPKRQLSYPDADENSILSCQTRVPWCSPEPKALQPLSWAGKSMARVFVTAVCRERCHVKGQASR